MRGLVEVAVHLACTWCGGQGWTMDGLCHCTTDKIEAQARRIAELEARAPAVTVTAKGLSEALELAPDAPDTELSLEWMPDRLDAETGEPMPAGVYAYLTEYPDEGVLGPLGARELDRS